MKPLSLNSFIKQATTDKIFSHVVPSNVYAAPVNMGTGDGSNAANAAELQSVLWSSNVINGDTVILINGNYTAKYVVYKANITITAEHCYQAVINGSIQIGDYSGINGAGVTLQNIRIYNSDTWRGTWSTPQGSISRPVSIEVVAPNVNIINNIVHDGGVGITAYTDATDCLIYGNVFFNAGWADNVGGGAQNLYIAGLNKIVRHNVFAGAFKKTFAVYTTHGIINNIDVEQNIIYERTTTLFGGQKGVTVIGSFVENHIINRGVQFGYVYPQNGNITITDNIIYTELAAGLTLSYFENVSVLRNKIIAGSSISGGYQGQSITINYPNIIGIYDFNNNEYHHLGVITHFVNIEGVTHYNFAAWQALGHDVASTYDELLPAVNESYVYLNDYAAVSCRKGMVVIWNWQELNTVDVDLTPLGLVNGHTYTWRNAQDPLVDIDTFVYTTGVDVTFPMTGRSVAYPIGFSELLIENQFPKFGCFIIEEL